MSEQTPRTIVLGLDGLDARLTRRLILAGVLPRMGRLAQSHGFREVLSTTPAESAVAWTSFSRGGNPGRTNVFDFVGRDVGSYLPRLMGSRSETVDVGLSLGQRQWTTAAAGVGGGLAGYASSRCVTRRAWLKGCAALGAGGSLAGGVGVALHRWLPDKAERIESTVQGKPWWDRLAASGQQCVAMRIPMAYPARAHPNVRLLGGLGVPDIHGTQGSYLLLSDAPESHGDSHVLPISWQGDHSRVAIPGPRDVLTHRRTVVAVLELVWLGKNRLRVRSGDAAQEINKGDWSAPIRVTFSVSPFVRRHAIARLHFCDAPGVIQLYLTPLQYDAAQSLPVNPISSPPGFAAELEGRIGPYQTIGWETQTAALISGDLDEQAYLVDAHKALALNEKQLLSELHDADWRHFMFVVQATDQITHIFFDKSVVSMREGGEIEVDHPLIRLYRRLDELVGRVADQAESLGSRLIVMSDHGFSPYRRAVNLNTWLARRGYIAIKDRSRWDGSSAAGVLDREVWSNVDWFNTRAFALGLGGIYLNVEGREPLGIVKRSGEYAFLQRRLIRDLEEWQDPVTGERLFKNVYRRQDVYSGPYVENAPDLILGFREGYRVSSSTVVGGIPPDEITDNRSAWKADHCGIDASLIPGVCLTNFHSNWPHALPIAELASRIWPTLHAQVPE